MTHPTHEAVCVARGSTFYDWGLTGSKFIKDLRDWKKMGKTGTGFA